MSNMQNAYGYHSRGLNWDIFQPAPDVGGLAGPCLLSLRRCRDINPICLNGQPRLKRIIDVYRRSPVF